MRAKLEMEYNQKRH